MFTTVYMTEYIIIRITKTAIKQYNAIASEDKKTM